MGEEFYIDIEAASQELHIRSEILKKLITSFSRTLAGKVDELKQALEAGDIIKMRALLHEIKGTAGNLRLHQLHQTADTMHVEVKGEADPEKMKAYFDEIKELSEELTQFVTKLP